MNEAQLMDSCLCAEITEDYDHPTGAFAPVVSVGDYYTYLNAGTCPDCGASMFRQGRCFMCMSCGFTSCGC